MLTKYRHLPWPRNLWSTVLLHEVPEESLPRDWEAALGCVFSTVTYKHAREIVLYYFRDGLTLQMIGEKYGTTRSATQQQLAKTIVAMSLPGRCVYFIYGLIDSEALLEARKEYENLLDRTSVMSLNLSARAQNCLMRAGVVTVGKLRRCSDEDLLNVRCLGQTTLNEIKECLSNLMK